MQNNPWKGLKASAGWSLIFEIAYFDVEMQNNPWKGLKVSLPYALP